MFKELDPGTMTRSPGLSYQELLNQDTHEVPAVLRLEMHSMAHQNGTTQMGGGYVLFVLIQF